MTADTVLCFGGPLDGQLVPRSTAEAGAIVATEEVPATLEAVGPTAPAPRLVVYNLARIAVPLRGVDPVTYTVALDPDYPPADVLGAVITVLVLSSMYRNP